LAAEVVFQLRRFASLLLDLLVERSEVEQEGKHVDHVGIVWREAQELEDEFNREAADLLLVCRDEHPGNHRS